MSHDQFLIRDYSVGSTAPSMDFEWTGQVITGYTIEFEVKFECGRTKTLSPTVIAEGDGASVAAQFVFDFPAGFWDEAGRHRGKLKVTSPSGLQQFTGFLFDVGP